MTTTLRELAGRVPPRQSSVSRRETAASDGHSGVDFGDKLAQELDRSSDADIQVSAHAEKRIKQRNILLNRADQSAMNDAMRTLADKGARDAVLVRSDAAFVVNVPNRTIVTALDHAEMSQRVFSNIDSAYVMKD